MCVNGSELAAHFFFFNDTATTEIYTLSLHDALPIFQALVDDRRRELAQRLDGLRSERPPDRKSTRLNSSHQIISYAVFCLKRMLDEANMKMPKLVKFIESHVLGFECDWYERIANEMVWSNDREFYFRYRDLYIMSVDGLYTTVSSQYGGYVDCLSSQEFG